MNSAQKRLKPREIRFPIGSFNGFSATASFGGLESQTLLYRHLQRDKSCAMALGSADGVEGGYSGQVTGTDDDAKDDERTCAIDRKSPGEQGLVQVDTKEGKEPTPTSSSTDGGVGGAGGAVDIGPTVTFRAVSCADEMNPSCRNSMEDAHQTIAHFDGDPTMSFFAVYDGHGGRGTVDFVVSRLEDALAEELRKDDNASIEERITRAYAITDGQSKEADVLTSGATAVTCLLKAEGGRVTVYTANVGDSRAVLARGGKAERLTYDHKAEDVSEQERVEAAGGFVLRNRVLGILAVSRSFGNQGMKEFVISEPYVSETRLCPECKFLLLACDGVWDVFDDQEAIEFVAKALESKAEADVARLLLEEALARGSTDNITVVIVFF